MDWLAIELLNGLTKLLSLGLDRTPATDVIEVTVGTWHEAITTGRRWEQDRDAPRIRAAFVTLANTVDRWPQPKHFLDALPRVEQAAIAHEVKPLPPEEAAQHLADIRRILDEPLPQHNAKAIAPTREVPSKADIEAELQAHYAKRLDDAQPLEGKLDA